MSKDRGAPYSTRCAPCAPLDEKDKQKWAVVKGFAGECLQDTHRVGEVRLRCDVCGTTFGYRPERCLTNSLATGDEASRSIRITREMAHVASIQLPTPDEEGGTLADQDLGGSCFVELVGVNQHGEGMSRLRRLKLALTRYSKLSTVRDLCSALNTEGVRWMADEEHAAKQAIVARVKAATIASLIEEGFAPDVAEEMGEIEMPTEVVPWPSWLVGEHQPEDYMQQNIAKPGGNVRPEAKSADEEEAAG